jgi:hypothetical protein
MNPTHRMDLSSSLFKGLSFHVDTGLDQAVVASDIQAMPIVRKVWPISLYDKQDFATAPYANGSNSSTSSDTFSTHLMGHVDRLHAEGLTGNGTFVAVIDTGIDYLHPALGGCFGPGCKVAYVSVCIQALRVVVDFEKRAMIWSAMPMMEPTSLCPTLTRTLVATTTELTLLVSSQLVRTLITSLV